tara:strand:- start:439 stop:1317 length:879 start_codon:yes stop_codon:yes gene_type:complete
MKIVVLSLFFVSFSVFGGAKKSKVLSPIDKLKEKVEQGKKDITRIKNDLSSIKSNVQNITGKSKKNEQKTESNEEQLNQIQGQFDKLKNTITELSTGETTTKDLVVNASLAQIVDEIKEMTESIAAIKNDYSLMQELFLANYRLMFYVTKDTCKEVITDDNAGLGCSYKLKNNDNLKKYFQNIKIDIKFITNEQGQVLISGLEIKFRHPDPKFKFVLEKIGVSPKVIIGGQEQEIDLSFSSAVEDSGNKSTGVKTFTAILDEPMVLAGDEYTALSTIRDSEVNQDLSFELKM